MASLQRSIKRSMMFKGMNKIQKALWHSQHGGKNKTKGK